MYSHFYHIYSKFDVIISNLPTAGTIPQTDAGPSSIVLQHRLVQHHNMFSCFYRVYSKLDVKISNLPTAGAIPPTDAGPGSVSATVPACAAS